MEPLASLPELVGSVSTPVDFHFPFLEQRCGAHHFRKAVTYLALGQFEMARVELTLLSTAYPQFVFRWLKEIICYGPPRRWLSTPSIPSAAHLAWLCITELRPLLEKGTCGVDLPAGLVHQVAFEVILHYAQHPGEDHAPAAFSEAVLQELRNYHTSLWAGVSTPTVLSVNASVQLKRFFTGRADLGHALCGHLMAYSSIYSPSARMLQRLYIEIISAFIENCEFEMAVDHLKYLDFTPEMASDIGVEALFHKLVVLSQQWSRASLGGNSLPGNPESDGEFKDSEGVVWTAVILRRRVYEALLACKQPYPITSYSALEDAIVADQIRTDRLLPLRIFSDGPESGLTEEDVQLCWFNLFNFARSANAHILEYMMESSIALAKAKDFQAASAVLYPTPTLKPLVVLLVWDDFVGDIDAQQRLVDLFWHGLPHPEDVDPILAENVALLSYQVKLAWWCCAKLLDVAKSEKHNVQVGPRALSEFRSPFDVANAVLKLLKCQSVIKTVRACLPTVELSDIRDIMTADPESTVDAAAQRDIDLCVILGYYTLVQVFRLYHLQLMDEDEPYGDSKTPPESALSLNVNEVVQTVSNHLNAIPKPEQKLAIVESLFSTLFTLASALRPPRACEDAATTDPSDVFLATHQFVSGILPIIRTHVDDIASSTDLSDELRLRISSLALYVEEAEWREEENVD